MPKGPASHLLGRSAVGVCVLILSAGLLWSARRVEAAGVGAAGVGAAGVGAAGVGPAATTAQTKKFAVFEAAWHGANPTALVGCMDAKGKITVLLLEKPFAGRAGGYDKERAGKSLKRYFEDIIEPKLKDVTPDNQRTSNPSVRIYDYTYRPKKGNQLTTRLEVRLKRVEGAWVLNSLSERRKS